MQNPVSQEAVKHAVAHAELAEAQAANAKTKAKAAKAAYKLAKKAAKAAKKAAKTARKKADAALEAAKKLRAPKPAKAKPLAKKVVRIAKRKYVRRAKPEPFPEAVEQAIPATETETVETAPAEQQHTA